MITRRITLFSKEIRTYSTTSPNVTESTKFPAGSTVFSLIQPTGKIHLGNYLGAVSNWKDMVDQDNNPDTKFFFGTADLHALTSLPDPIALKRHRHEAIASLLSAGIDTERAVIYHQSSVPAHNQLMWILTCLTGMGSLNRMTQWKLKAQAEASDSIYSEKIMGQTKAGTFAYPALQAADILIYKSTHVPIGDDQTQHLELCRDIAQTFNSTYKKDYFPMPKSVLTPTKKILALRNTSKKMSKSDPDQNSCIYITEEPDTIARKIAKATTDSIQGKVYYDPIERPGVSNLINIVSGLTRTSIDHTVRDLDWVQNHKQLKDHVVELIIEEFKDKRQLYHRLMNDTGYLDDVTAQGTKEASAIADANYKEIALLVGLD